MFILFFVCFLCLIKDAEVAKKDQQSNLIQTAADVKDLKKLFRTRNNVLVIFAKSKKDASRQMPLFNEVAEQMRGLSTLCIVDCSEDKKLCKKMKASPSDVDLKHYKDGEFNKDYDRKDTVKSMVSFLKDPTGDIPWDEDTTAADVVHLESYQHLNKMLSKDKKPALVMFYAPWCGYCKKLKPDFAAAASELKAEANLAGMDVDKPENFDVKRVFNITGYPTISYFENGRLKHKFGGENNKDGIIKWMRDPTAPKEPEKEEEWADVESDVVHLGDDTFDEYVKANPSVLVMFYAPWCGHCKKMKPEFTDASATMREEEIEGTLAAIDATKHQKLAQTYGIKGFPTVLYFKDGERAFDMNERTADKIVDFMKDPKEPPPPPPGEDSWVDIPSNVEHLTDESFKPFLKKKKHTLVMFYAPWCGHCKKAKPEFTQAAAQYDDNNKVAFAAVDCTVHTGVCSAHDVSGYPTFVYFNYGKNSEKYTGGREEPDFVAFMKDPLNPVAAEPPAPPSPEIDWEDVDGHELLHHLTDDTFDDFMAEQGSVLVMFYAPWCGHCKAMKPAYGEAATILKEQHIPGVLAAVDATVSRNVPNRYDVRGFPTIKYFKNGELQFEYERGRKTQDIVDFMKNPVASTPPPQEPQWSDTPSNVNHLDDSNFHDFLKNKENVLVMFYAPWCGHCKKAKPEFTAAANTLQGSTEHFLVAVDCTAASTLCVDEGVKGYPTLKGYKKGSFHTAYTSARTKDDFLTFVKKMPEAAPKIEEPVADTKDTSRKIPVEDKPQEKPSSNKAKPAEKKAEPQKDSDDKKASGKKIKEEL